ncbi:hypothetical protein PHLGIDRAFT_264499 [Phlebiopsis gigantea 11061_1 CR5-6]|uniref:Uncharacterized protein n=1 Tax=Phlebiopsis gigantea (strain 11061_1 CR5-6) TaxID=745531 RepID=A0A0C3SE27_PHLG1|nr:hypothetical protein PHLGIDRAFT_264499 [Phlebiopsis gigantea 11061_1 CR5-6]
MARSRPAWPPTEHTPQPGMRCTTSARREERTCSLRHCGGTRTARGGRSQTLRSGRACCAGGCLGQVRGTEDKVRRGWRSPTALVVRPQPARATSERRISRRRVLIWSHIRSYQPGSSCLPRRCRQSTDDGTSSRGLTEWHRPAFWLEAAVGPTGRARKRIPYLTSVHIPPRPQSCAFVSSNSAT